MGRHRRATRAATTTSAPTSTATGRHRGGHRKRGGGAPVRSGLLGASAAMAVGAVAVASGLVPGAGDVFDLRDSGEGATSVQADGTPEITPFGTPDPDGLRADHPPTSRGHSRSASPSPDTSPSETPADGKSDSGKSGSGADNNGGAPERPDKGDEPPTPSATDGKQDGKQDGKAGGDGKPESRERSAPAPKTSPAAPPAPTPVPSAPPAAPTAPKAPDAWSSAESQVLKLVNQERAKAGCQPLRADASLAGLARDYSRDMARRGYFSHTDPDGRSPWDRARARGISHMGGENIARGQANAQSVMDAWMKSPGHRANILNCDFKTMGVGAHFASGGPWWTQAFGY
ncbi:CAP domain-containing protein [Streptomyces durbertensis]|uniref:CAP domain-containing protein n=1 Tax=Streptomyces durbertensis TaxID=2448886 RepID=A0ABR6EDL9_9ACTN|nr:CAP domain-containing protein [Streptomyces durbertensis]MBB1243268.1 CAP domain-containing protein [Streptomyces durbertensis]